MVVIGYEVWCEGLYLTVFCAVYYKKIPQNPRTFVPIIEWSSRYFEKFSFYRVFTQPDDNKNWKVLNLNKCVIFFINFLYHTLEICKNIDRSVCLFWRYKGFKKGQKRNSSTFRLVIRNTWPSNHVTASTPKTLFDFTSIYTVWIGLYEWFGIPQVGWKPYKMRTSRNIGNFPLKFPVLQALFTFSKIKYWKT